MSNKKTFVEHLLQVKKDGYIDLKKLAELEKINLIYSEPKEYKDDFSGLIKKVNDVYTIIINGDHSENRKRFSLAHEIAHYFLHKDEIEEAAIVDNGLYRSGVSDSIEIEANNFAAGILMPFDLIEKHMEDARNQGMKRTNQVLEYVAEKMKVSKQSLAIRMGIPFD